MAPTEGLNTWDRKHVTHRDQKFLFFGYPLSVKGRRLFTSVTEQELHACGNKMPQAQEGGSWASLVSLNWRASKVHQIVLQWMKQPRWFQGCHFSTHSGPNPPNHPNFLFSSMEAPLLNLQEDGCLTWCSQPLCALDSVLGSQPYSLFNVHFGSMALGSNSNPVCNFLGGLVLPTFAHLQKESIGVN